MQRADVNVIELEYHQQGHGDPLLLIHEAFIPDAMRPLGGQDALEPFQLICYHRRGFAGGSRPPGPTTIADHAADGVGLLDQLGIDRAQVVGHSSGAAIALETAATEPARVSSLALLETPVPDGRRRRCLHGGHGADRGAVLDPRRPGMCHEVARPGHASTASPKHGARRRQLLVGQRNGTKS